MPLVTRRQNIDGGFTAQSASLDRLIIFAVAASDDGAIGSQQQQ